MLAPFRGVRYAPHRVSDLAKVTSPPYDVVGAAAATRLRDSDPHNVIRLTVPADDDAQRRPDDRYRTAGATMRRWIAEGVLVPDVAAGLYVYEERADDTGTRTGHQRGLIGALELSHPEAGIVLPHEDVVAAAVADRRKIMEATAANLEPIFLLYEGGGAASQLVDEMTETRQPMIEAVAGGTIHRLWAVTSTSQIAAVAADLAGRHAMIADGHHRYAAYLDIQARRHAGGTGRGPWDYGLALLVDSLAHPPRLDPIHRVIPRLPPTTAVKLARSAFSVRELPQGTDLPTALVRLRDASRGAGAGRDVGPGRDAGPGAGRDGRSSTGGDAGRDAGRDAGNRVAFLLAGDGRFYLLTDPDPAQLRAAVPAGRSERWQWLDAAVLHELLLGAVWRVHDDQTNVRVVHDDAPAAIQAALPGGTAVICNPPLVNDVLAVAVGKEKMPRKSTSFGPKPRTGLVMRSFAYG